MALPDFTSMYVDDFNDYSTPNLPTNVNHYNQFAIFSQSFM